MKDLFEKIDRIAAEEEQGLSDRPPSPFDVVDSIIAAEQQPSPSPRLGGLEYPVTDIAKDLGLKVLEGAAGVGEGIAQLGGMASRAIERPGVTGLLAEQAGDIGESVGLPEDVARAPERALQTARSGLGGLWRKEADFIGEKSKTASDFWGGLLSEPGKDLEKQPFFEGSFTDAIVGGGKWTDRPVTKAVMSAAESFPGMAASLVPGGAAMKTMEAARFAPAVAQRLSRLGFADKTAKTLADFIQGGAAMGAGEGIVSGADASKSVGDDIRKADVALLAEKSPRWQEYFALTSPDLPLEARNKMTRELLAQDAETAAFATVAAGSTVTGTLTGGGLLGDLMKAPRNFASRFLSMPKEAWQEAWQSGFGEQMAQNVVSKGYADQDKDIWGGVPDAFFGGGAAGAVLGSAGLVHGGRDQGEKTSDEGDRIRGLNHHEVQQHVGRETWGWTRSLLKTAFPDRSDFDLDSMTQEAVAKSVDERVKGIEEVSAANLERNVKTMQLRKANESTENLLTIQGNQDLQQAIGIHQDDIDWLVEERDLEDQALRDFAAAPPNMREGATAAIRQEMDRRYQERLTRAAKESGKAKVDAFWQGVMDGINKGGGQGVPGQPLALPAPPPNFELVDRDESMRRLEVQTVEPFQPWPKPSTAEESGQAFLTQPQTPAMVEAGARAARRASAEDTLGGAMQRGEERIIDFWNDTIGRMEEEQGQVPILPGERPALPAPQGFELLSGDEANYRRAPGQGFEMVSQGESAKRVAEEKAAATDRGKAKVDTFFNGLLRNIEEAKQSGQQPNTEAERKLLEIHPSAFSGFETAPSDDLARKMASRKLEAIEQAQFAGYITDQEAAEFEKEVKAQRRAWVEKNKAAGQIDTEQEDVKTGGEVDTPIQQGPLVAEQFTTPNGRKLISITGETFAHKDAIKAIPGARWNKTRKAWTVPEENRADVEKVLAGLLKQADEQQAAETVQGTPAVKEETGNPEWFDEKGDLTLAGAKEQLRRLEDAKAEYERSQIAQGRVPVFDARKNKQIREAKDLVDRLEREQQPKSTEEQIKALSPEDISNLFDEVDQERAAQKEKKKKESRERKPKEDTVTFEVKSLQTGKVSELKVPNNPIKKTSGQIAKEGGIAANKAVKEALAGLSKLFGDPNTLRSGPAFDEETYRQAKPHFVAAWTSVKDVGYSVKELIGYFYSSFGDKIRPYLERFVNDVRDGDLSVELPPPNKNLTENTPGDTINKNPEGEQDDDRQEQGDIPGTIRQDDPAAEGGGAGALGGLAAEGNGKTEQGGEAAGSSPEGGDQDLQGDRGTAPGRVPEPRGGRGGNAEVHPPQTGKTGQRRTRKNPGDAGRIEDAPQTIPGINFVITDEVELGKGGEAVKFQDNVRAINTLKTLQREQRRATPAEQRILARYVGWGGLANAFRNTDPGAEQAIKPGWEERVAELEKLLTPEELAVARNSTQNAHYTSKTVVEGMWQAVKRLGFQGGNVMEPSVGTGNFIGLLPSDLAGATNVLGIEYDNITADIASLLYPRSSIVHSPFERVPVPSDSFDLVIGNPPFGQKRLVFRYNPDLSRHTIHNQFFLAGMEALRPGGIQAMVVSRYLLDAKDSEVRKLLAREGKLLGAIRLPETAFKENAKTEVITDIIFLQKFTNEERQARNVREMANKGTFEPYPKWVETTEIPDPLGGEPMTVNKYFAEQPEAILGTMDRSGSMRFGADITVKLPDGADMAKLLSERILKLLPEGIAAQPHPADKAIQAFKDMTGSIDIVMKGLEDGNVLLTSTGDVEQIVEKESASGEFLLTKRRVTPESPWSPNLQMAADGKWFREIDQLDEKGAKVKITGTKRNAKTREVFASEKDIPASLKLGADGYQALKDGVKLLDSLYEQIRLEILDAPEREIEQHRKSLRRDYDDYVRNHGYLHANRASRVIAGMPNSALLYSLEAKYKAPIDKKKADKLGVTPRPAVVVPAAILKERVNFPYEKPERAENPEDALAITLSESGYVDLDRLAELLGVDRDQAVRKLHGDLETPLIFKDPETGKWETADEYLGGNVVKKLNAAREARLTKNVEALEKVQPEPWGADKVTPVLGATWIPTEDYAAFLSSLTGAPVTVRFAKLANAFAVIGSADTAKAKHWNTSHRSVLQIAEALLNSKTIRITRVDSDGNTIFLQAETEEAIAKGEEIRAAFDDWIFQDGDRRKRLVDLFNQKYNVRVNKQRSGQHLKLPGKVPDSIIAMRRHQMNAIWRGVVDRFVLYDHAVGAGKTFTGIARAMERRRMGLSKKPMFVVPNHIVEQFAADVYKLYPGAKMLAAGKNDMSAAKRRRLFAKIATGDWDIVIVPHSSFKFIGINPETEKRYLQEQLDLAMQAVDEAWDAAEEDGYDREGRRKPHTVKEAERVRDNFASKLEKLQARGDKKDRLLTFEQLGVDDLTVDEAHEFKNLFYNSSLSVRGMNDKAGSGKAYDLWAKARVLREMPTGSMAFMTGTPISNSAVEMYGLMRYLAAEDLKESGLEHFDAWRNQFTTVTTKFEQTESGKGLKEVNRIGRDWMNMRSLMDMYYSFADAVSNDDIIKWYSEDNNGALFPIPAIKDGGRSPVKTDPTPAQRAMLDEVVAGFESLPYIQDPRLRNATRLRLMDRARKLSLDIRAVDPRHPSKEEGGKLEAVADNVTRLYKKWEKDKGTQLIFLDRSVPKSKGDAKLIAEYDTIVKKIEDAERTGDEEALRDLAEKLEKFDHNEIRELKAAQAGGWNAYQQIKDNLIAQGIPEKEIRFVQEADTDAKKKDLFEEVNAGTVRVLIGSTPRMGAGTNVQERLVGLHHVDVTWKPSDIEQREGRIIRQGNSLLEKFGDDFEVEILAYVTEATIDAKMWSLNATKLRMINGIRNYTGEFNMEFEDEDSVSMAEIAAIASGEPLQLERVQLAADIDRLERLKKNHRKQLFASKDELEARKRQLEILPERITVYEKWSEKLEPLQEIIEKQASTWTIDIEGKIYTRETLRAAYDALKEIKSQAQQAADALNEAEQAAANEGEEDGEKKKKPKKHKAVFLVEINGEKFRSFDKAEAKIQEVLGDGFLMISNFQGKEYIERRTLSNAFNQAINAKIEAGESEGDIGTVSINGIDADVSFQQVEGEEKDGKPRHETTVFIELDDRAASGARVSLGYGRQAGDYQTSTTVNSSWNIAISSFLNSISSLPKTLHNSRNQVAEAKEFIPELEKLANKPFPKERDLTEKQDRLKVVESELASRQKSDPDGGNSQARYSKAPPPARQANVSELTPGQRRIVTLLVEKGILKISGKAPDNETQGKYLNGIVTLFPNNIESGNLWSVLVHDLGGHLGKVMQADEAYLRLLQSVDDRKSDESPTGEAIRKAIARVPAGTRPEHRRSEILAYLIENESDPGIVRRFIALVKNLLVRIGISPDIFTAADLRALAEAAVRREARRATVKESLSVGEMSPAMLSVKDSSTATFATWFGNSKVSAIVYHGSPTFGQGDNFTFEDRGSQGAKTKTPGAGLGTFFTEDRSEALSYAGPAGQVFPMHLRIENPLEINSYDLPAFQARGEAIAYRKRKQLQGYDGIHLKDLDHWIIFEPNQAKSADQNNGAFSRENNDIRYSKRATKLPKKIEGISPEMKKLADEIKARMEAVKAKPPVGLPRVAAPDKTVGQKILEKSMTGAGNISRAKVVKRFQGYEEMVVKLKNEAIDINEKQRLVANYIQKFPRQVRGTAGLEKIAAQIGSARTEKRRLTIIRDALRRIDAAHEEYTKRELLKKLVSLLTKNAPKMQGRIARQTSGGYDLYRELQEIKKVLQMKSEAVSKRLDEIMLAAADKDLGIEEALELRRLSIYGGLFKASSVEVYQALQELEGTIKGKKAAWFDEMKALSDRRKATKNEVVRVVTGGRELKTETERQKDLRDKAKLGQRIKDTITSFDDKHQSFEWLLDKLSLRDQESGILDSFLVKTFGALVQRATTEEHTGTAAHMALLSSKLTEIYGLEGRALEKQLNKNTVLMKETRVFRRNESGQKAEELLLNQNQAYKRWMEWQDPTLQEQLAAQGYTDRTIEEIERFMTPEVKEWAKWQLEEFYPQYYGGVNEVFKKMFYTDMPFNPRYSPIKRRYSRGTEDPQLLTAPSHYSSVINGALRGRVDNTREIELQDGDTALAYHIAQMEHFKAWVDPMRELRATLGSETVRQAIKDFHGQTALTTLNGFLDDFARGKSGQLLDAPLMQKFRANFTTAVIGLNPVVFLKQLSALPAYSMEMPAGSWMKHFPVTPGAWIEAFKTLGQSEVLKARYGSGFERDMIAAMSSRIPGRIAGTKKVANKLMFLVGWGDRISVIGGGWPLYQYHYEKARKEGLNETDARAIAMQEFEASTERTQQAGNLKDLNAYQRAGAFPQLFTMFMTAPNAYYRQMAGAVRELKKSLSITERANRKGLNPKTAEDLRKRAAKLRYDSLKRLFIAGVVLPVFFQFIASAGFDDDDMLRAVVLGPLNGLFIVRDLSAGLYDLIAGNRIFDTPGTPPILTTFDEARKAFSNFSQWKAEDWALDKDFWELVVAGGTAAGNLAGLPVGPAARLIQGGHDVATGNTVSPMLRLAGYSESRLDTANREYLDLKREIKEETKDGSSIYNAMQSHDRHRAELRKRLRKLQESEASREEIGAARRRLQEANMGFVEKWGKRL